MSPLRFSTILGNLAAGATLVHGAITVDVSAQHQQIDGFGFSQAFGRAKEFEESPEALRQSALDYLFDTSTGAGFSIIRNRIGSGGEGDSILPESPGSPSGTPEYKWDGDDSGQVWLTKQAVEYGVKTIIADAWSAPGFMKTNGDEAEPGYLCTSTGNECESGDWQKAYADLLVNYVQFYAEEGLDITHLGFVNEPDWEVTYSQMQIKDDAADAISFTRVLDGAISAAGLDNLQIICCDSAGWDAQDAFTTALVEGGATDYLDVITGHSYTSQPSGPLNQTSLPKWNTEAGPGDGEFVTTWYESGADNEGFTWAEKIAQALVESELSAYLFWQGFQNGNTESPMHFVDTLDGETPTPSGIFWAFAMWSRHIRPQAHRVATSGELADGITAAFVNADSSVVVVFTNKGDAEDAQVSFEGFEAAEASAWVTDNDHTFEETEVSLDGGSVGISVPARSVVTLKLTAWLVSRTR